MLNNLEALNENDIVNVNGGVISDSKAVYTGSCFVYEIKKGDCLSVIAQRYGVKMSVLQQINNITNPDLIYAGNKILVPYNGK